MHLAFITEEQSWSCMNYLPKLMRLAEHSQAYSWVQNLLHAVQNPGPHGSPA